MITTSLLQHGRRSLDDTGCPQQLELFEVNRQQVTVTFDGEQIVSDAGLLPIRQLDQQLGILAEAARRLPDPRSQLFVTHSAERIITQQVSQILAGDPDGNDAQRLRDDPLFKTIVGIDPREELSLASGSTINRFQHAFTRREAEKPIEERDVIFEVRNAQIERIKAMNEFLVDVFVRTRQQQPPSLIIDLDPTDDPTHGQQQLSLFHGDYKQHQYFFDPVRGTLDLACGCTDPGGSEEFCGVLRNPLSSSSRRAIRCS